MRVAKEKGDVDFNAELTARRPCPRLAFDGANVRLGGVGVVSSNLQRRLAVKSTNLWGNVGHSFVDGKFFEFGRLVVRKSAILGDREAILRRKRRRLATRFWGSGKAPRFDQVDVFYLRSFARVSTR